MAVARVHVTLKKSVFDPQGRAIKDALGTLGYATVADVRQGKFFELSLPDVEPDQARTIAEEVATRVLSNPVIESWQVEVVP